MRVIILALPLHKALRCIGPEDACESTKCYQVLLLLICPWSSRKVNAELRWKYHNEYSLSLDEVWQICGPSPLTVQILLINHRSPSWCGPRTSQQHTPDSYKLKVRFWTWNQIYWLFLYSTMLPLGSESFRDQLLYTLFFFFYWTISDIQSYIGFKHTTQWFNCYPY